MSAVLRLGFLPLGVHCSPVWSGRFFSRCWSSPEYGLREWCVGSAASCSMRVRSPSGGVCNLLLYVLGVEAVSRSGEGSRSSRSDVSPSFFDGLPIQGSLFLWKGALLYSVRCTSRAFPIPYFNFGRFCLGTSGAKFFAARRSVFPR